MTDNMIECKKDSLRQMQTGDIKMGFAIQHQDMPDYLFSDPMGKRYYVVFIDADHYDANEGQSANNAQSNCPEIPDSSVSANNAQTQNEKSEGDRIRVRAVMLAKDEEFQSFAKNTFISIFTDEEENARNCICSQCNIESRSELTTNKEAQEKFKQLDQKYKDWQYEKTYADNLSKP